MVDEQQLIVDRLLEWAGKSGRQFPWRSTSDKYHLAVAEILLQKTKACDVQPIWEKFISYFKTPASLIYAGDDDVLNIIKGLGLGRQRAMRLKAMARAIASSGMITNLVPGLGAYGSSIVTLSAGAPLSTVPIDSNIARIICRYYGLSFVCGEPRKKQIVKTAVKKLLDTKETSKEKLAVVYGLIDFGDAVCKSAVPSCSSCPLSDGCSFSSAGTDG